MIPVVLLLAVLGFAVARPFGLPEAAGAVPAALVVLALGLVPWPAVAVAGLWVGLRLWGT